MRKIQTVKDSHTFNYFNCQKSPLSSGHVTLLILTLGRKDQIAFLGNQKIPLGTLLHFS